MILKPKNPSALHYFRLSRKYNKYWLVYREYRELLWYWESYEEISNLQKFEKKMIEKQPKHKYVSKITKQANI
jgi:hypothetical protein